uniref:C-type lectin domain-containing protein n=1 Tax=Gasterosteus aculeatus aculeatus TaxID=481459 RepID=A0AAQ4QZL7_GASAC
MEGRQYVNSPAMNNVEEQTTNQQSLTGRSKIYKLVGVSFFLLCIIQLLLYVLFSNCDVSCNRSEKNSTRNFTGMSNGDLNVERDRLAIRLKEVVDERDRLSLEKKEVVKERDRLVLEKKEVVKERDRLVLEKKEVVDERDRLSLEKKEMVKERDRLSLEKKEMVKERDRLVLEKKEVVDERDRLSLEKKEMVKERDRLSLEKKEMVKERDRLSLEKKEMVRENTRLAEENSNLKVEKSELQNDIDKLRKQLASQGCLETLTSKCPEGWNEYMSSCYQLSCMADTWQRARDDCQSKGSHLVMLKDACEEDIVRRLGGNLNIWIGMSCSWWYNPCTLVDGSNPTYTNWYQWQPFTPCDCVYSAQHSWNLRAWYFGRCSQRRYWICEMW